MSLIDLLLRSCVPDELTLESVRGFGDGILRALGDDWDEEISGLAGFSLPELVAFTEATLRTDHPNSQALVLLVVADLTEGATSLVFEDASDVLLCCPLLLRLQGSAIVRGLLVRYELIRTGGSGYQAYRCLETSARIVLTGASRELYLVDALLDLTASDSSELLERVPRLLGMADEFWHENRAREVLRELLEVKDAQSNALFELGLADLRDSLESESFVDSARHMTKARERFLAAELSDESRDDAAIYRRVIDIVLSFGSAQPQNAVAEAAESLREVMTRRSAWLSGLGTRDWTHPRMQAEIEWFSLTRTLRESSHYVNRPSWLYPAQAMEHVLAAYNSDRSFTTIDCMSGLRVVVQPTIEAAFVQREGLMAHVEDLASESTPSEAFAIDLRAFLENVKAAETASLKADAVDEALRVAPNLMQEFGVIHATAIVQLVEQQPEFAGRLEYISGQRRTVAQMSRDPLVDDLLESVGRDLSACSEFVGETRESFVEVLRVMLQFLASRADIGKSTIGERTKYLFPSKDGKPFTEKFLQLDFGEFLQASRLRFGVRFEEPDVASGRADLTVTTQQSRFSIEVKREVSNSSRSYLVAHYAAQAAGYALTTAGLGVLLVLDLTDQTHGIASVRDSVWVEKVSIPNGQPRYLVIGVVRGNRKTPSKLTVGNSVDSSASQDNGE